MLDRAKRFRRRALAENGGLLGRSARYSDALREEAVLYYRDRRASGATKVSIANDLGLAQMTLARWAESAGGHIKPVRVVTDVVAEIENGAPVVVVTPSGHRVEGLTVSMAAELLRALR